MSEDLRELTAEQISSAFIGGVGTTVVSASGHGWTLRSVRAGGPEREKPGAGGWFRLRFEATSAPVSQCVLLEWGAQTIEPTVLVDP